MTKQTLLMGDGPPPGGTFQPSPPSLSPTTAARSVQVVPLTGQQGKG